MGCRAWCRQALLSAPFRTWLEVNMLPEYLFAASHFCRTYRSAVLFIAFP